MTTFLERYLGGEHEQVWAELVALGAGVRSLHVLADAEAVAYETMRRARDNADELIIRLTAVGYTFGLPNGETWIPVVPRQAPDADVPAQVARLEALAGLLPLAIRAWYEVVGAVCLVGNPPWAETEALPDALYIDDAGAALDELLLWQEDRGEDDEPSSLCLAPDEYHKADISGGPPYSIRLPNRGADALVEYEWHGLHFVAYLREVFACGGFPGLAREPGGLPEHIQRLAQGLKPI
jgi:hypothetical protein